jgi:two-component system chemotaxis sensor kinase CheA
LRDVFHTPDASPPQRENVLIVSYGGGKAGIAVDELLGKGQAVIKPLGKIFARTTGLAGSTILGNGRVALILDVPALVREAHARRHNRPVANG